MSSAVVPCLYAERSVYSATLFYRKAISCVFMLFNVRISLMNVHVIYDSDVPCACMFDVLVTVM